MCSETEGVFSETLEIIKEFANGQRMSEVLEHVWSGSIIEANEADVAKF